MRVETLLPIGKVDPGLRDVSMRPDLAKVPDMAREVEALGYDGLVSGETKNDPYVPLVLGAASTERIRLTTAVVIAFPRSPTVTALAAWDVQSLSKGRLAKPRHRDVQSMTEHAGHDDREAVRAPIRNKSVQHLKPHGVGLGTHDGAECPCRPGLRMGPGLGHGRRSLCRASALHGLAECQIPALPWMVELHRLRIEPLRIKSAATKPPKSALVFLVCGVAHHGHEVLVPTDATAVLGWTCPLAREAARIPHALLARPDRLKSDLVFPAVSEVVLVPGNRTRVGEVAGDGDLPSRQDGLVPLEGILIWNADLHRVARARPADAKKVQVVVEPTHGILDGDMQVPEGVGPGHLDGPPDRRHYLQKDDSELVDLDPGSHALCPAVGHRRPTL